MKLKGKLYEYQCLWCKQLHETKHKNVCPNCGVHGGMEGLRPVRLRKRHTITPRGRLLRDAQGNPVRWDK